LLWLAFNSKQLPFNSGGLFWPALASRGKTYQGLCRELCERTTDVFEEKNLHAIQFYLAVSGL